MALNQVGTSLPKCFDFSSQFYAYSHKEINEEDSIIKLKKYIDQTIQHIYVKEMAD